MNAMLVELPQEQTAQGVIVYPESDGKRMSDNTKQARWIMVLHGNIETLLANELAFVAADLMWYARRGFPEDCAAPDVFVAFGRPKGERGSYKQWEEGDVAPQVVFEVLSPGNTPEEMEEKDAFYNDHEVQEYYIYDPDKDHLSVYTRKGTVLRRYWFQRTFTSPLLGITFDLTGPEMQVFYPDGSRFLTFAELAALAQNLQATQQRIRRMAELNCKSRQGKLTPEEARELEELEHEAERR